MSFWEKAHSFYIPRRLFKADTSELNQEWTSIKKLKFVTAAMMSSECYSAKRRAFGLAPMKRGGISQCVEAFHNARHQNSRAALQEIHYYWTVTVTVTVMSGHKMYYKLHSWWEVSNWVMKNRV
jgi:hypothetical protein